MYGGRWNSVGTPVVYASSNLSLAVLEMLVHVDPEDLPRDLVAIQVQAPDPSSAEQIRLEDLPEDWADRPDHPACRTIGDRWAARGESLLLRVPSAVVWEEENVLVNPRHPEAGKVRIVSTRAFRFDRRLVE